MKQGNEGLFILKILVMMYIITGVILVVLAGIMYKTSAGSSFVSGGLIFTYIFSTFAGGFITGKKKRKQKYLWGLGMGILYFVVLFAISLLMQKGIDIQQTKAVSTFFMCAIGGMLGGMIS